MLLITSLGVADFDFLLKVLQSFDYRLRCNQVEFVARTSERTLPLGSTFPRNSTTEACHKILVVLQLLFAQLCFALPLLGEPLGCTRQDDSA